MTKGFQKNRNLLWSCCPNRWLFPTGLVSRLIRASTCSDDSGKNEGTGCVSMRVTCVSLGPTRGAKLEPLLVKGCQIETPCSYKGCQIETPSCKGVPNWDPFRWGVPNWNPFRKRVICVSFWSQNWRFSVWTFSPRFLVFRLCRVHERSLPHFVACRAVMTPEEANWYAVWKYYS